MIRKIPFPNNDLSPFQIQFIKIWRKHKNYPDNPYLDVGDVLELLFATSHTLEREGSDGRFFNFCLHNEESVVSWDGDDTGPLDTWLYQVKQNINKLLARGRTFNDEIDKP